jgi:hypothetical protein
MNLKEMSAKPKPTEKMGMTVNTINRSRRVVYLVVLLIFAVALTTALVLAGERNSEGTKKNTLQADTVPTLRAVCLQGMTNV